MMNIKVLKVEKQSDVVFRKERDRFDQHFHVTVECNGRTKRFFTPMFCYDGIDFYLDTFGMKFEATYTGENTKKAEKLVDTVGDYLINSKEYEEFENRVLVWYEELKEKKYPKIGMVHEIDDHGSTLHVSFDLEGGNEVDEPFELIIDRTEKIVYTDVDNYADTMKNWREYIGWEDDIIKQVLNSNKVRLKAAMESEYVRKYLK